MSNLTVQPFGQSVTIGANSTGQPFSVSYTTQGTTSVSVSAVSPAAQNNLVCVDDIDAVGTVGKSCNITFSNAGFEIYGATPGADVPNQLAVQSFSNINLRAVKDDGTGVCAPLLEGSQNVNLTFSCVSPATCQTPIEFGTQINADTPTAISLTFDNQGIAPLTDLLYRDAGSINLAISAVVDGATITSGNANVNVYPFRLNLSENITSSTYDAGVDFNISIRAVGADGATVLPNYQPGDLQFAVSRTGRTAAGYVNGVLQSDNPGFSIVAQITSSFTDVGTSGFSDGVLSFSASYNEVDTLLFDARDNNYLSAGIVIDNDQNLTLGPFIPAYFDVVANNFSFENTYTTATPFSYLGRDIGFSSAIEFTLSAKNADGDITQNYQSNGVLDDWSWLPDNDATPTGISLTQTGQAISLHNSGKANSANVSDGGVVQLGLKRLTISDMTVVYQKFKTEIVDEDDSAYTLDAGDAPFAASATMTVDKALFTRFDGINELICYNASYPSACNGIELGPITGAELRWGRLVIENAFGPETEDKLVPVRTEYWDGSEFVLNRDDSVNTEFAANSLTLTEIHPDNGFADITDNVTVVNRNIEITAGKTIGFEGIYVTKPDDGSRGSVIIELEPFNNADITWEDYLQFDWNGEDEAGVGNPMAEVTFGQYRGNDRIIHWREVFK